LTSAPYREPRVLEEIVHVRDADEVEISGNRVLEAGGGEAEVERKPSRVMSLAVRSRPFL
jgi:hypothetical protein